MHNTVCFLVFVFFVTAVFINLEVKSCTISTTLVLVLSTRCIVMLTKSLNALGNITIHSKSVK